MNILFLGYAVHPDNIQTLSGGSVAGNKMQWNILQQLKNRTENLKILTIWPVAVWPRDRSVFVSRAEIDIGDGLFATRIAFGNLPIVKQISQIFFMYNEAKRYLKKNPNTIILTYNMYPQIGIPAIRLQRQGYKVIPILADLPLDADYQRRGIGKLLWNAFSESTRKSILKANRVVVLNEHARDVFAPGKEFIVMEGGVNPKEYINQEEDTVCPINHEKNVVYGGSLAEYSGVRELVDAMELLDDSDIKLDIYGEGALKSYIQSKTGENIRFHGKVSNEEMKRIQKQAWLLVNPRPVNDLIAQVTFPSKILEYLMSGTPVLATRLSCFNGDYQKFMFLVDNNTPEEMAKEIRHISQMDEEHLKGLAQEARNFVLSEKNWEKQIDRLVDFIKEEVMV